MKHFELPTIEIERFALVDTIANSLIDAEEVPGGGGGLTPITTPEDDFERADGFYKRF